MVKFPLDAGELDGQGVPKPEHDLRSVQKIQKLININFNIIELI